MAAIFFSLLNMSLVFSARTQFLITREQSEQNRRIVDVVSKIVDWVNRLDDAVRLVGGASASISSSPSLDSPTKGKQGRLLTAIRKLLAN
jgi:ABC-type hemin transport system substrate-binding protein